MLSEDKEVAELLIQAGANKVGGAEDESENIYFTGYQGDQWSNICALVNARNSDAQWLRWFNPKKELVLTHTADVTSEFYGEIVVCVAWRGSTGDCSRAALCKNNGRAARESTYEFLRDHVRQNKLPLKIHYLDEELEQRMTALRALS